MLMNDYEHKNTSNFFSLKKIHFFNHTFKIESGNILKEIKMTFSSIQVLLYVKIIFML
jgi:hypothetical protein